MLYFAELENKEQRERKEEKEENKPMFLKDYERKQLLERGVMAGVSDSEEDEEDIEVSSGSPAVSSPAYNTSLETTPIFINCKGMGATSQTGAVLHIDYVN